MKTFRPYFLRGLAFVLFSGVTAWLFQQWRLKDRPSFVPSAEAEASTLEQQKVKEYVQQTQEISKLEDELRRMAASDTTNKIDELKKKLEALKSLRGYSFGSVDFTPVDLPKRIPAGATDPDSVWRTQMQNARAAMRESGLTSSSPSAPRTTPRFEKK